MKKIKDINDIKYATFKKADVYLKDIDNISTENVIKVVSLIYEAEEDLTKVPYEKVHTLFVKFLETMSCETTLITKFESDGVKYGFIPNFSEISTGELIDLDTLLIDKNFEGIASILYRPIIKEDKDGKYTIEEYKGYDENLFKEASVRFYLGFIDFFYKSYQILKGSFHTSTEQK